MNGMQCWCGFFHCMAQRYSWCKLKMRSLVDISSLYLLCPGRGQHHLLWNNTATRNTATRLQIQKQKTRECLIFHPVIFGII